MQANKQVLRRQEKRRRAGMNRAYWQRIGAVIEGQLRAQLAAWAWHDPIIAAFSALPDEPILMDLPGRSAWPQVKGKDLVFRACARSDLVAGWGGLMEPPQSAPVVQPDLILVPGLAFSPDGHRLGRGKGFYDRYLSASSALTIGVTDQAGLHESIPMASHDVSVLVVLTEVRAYGTGTEEMNHGDGRSGDRLSPRARTWTVGCNETSESSS
jgi:5-formyltetrahydrofolate cyclo-ligase